MSEGQEQTGTQQRPTTGVRLELINRFRDGLGNIRQSQDAQQKALQDLHQVFESSTPAERRLMATMLDVVRQEESGFLTVLGRVRSLVAGTARDAWTRRTTTTTARRRTTATRRTRTADIRSIFDRLPKTFGREQVRRIAGKSAGIRIAQLARAGLARKIGEGRYQKVAAAGGR